jgi:hypothetical protein
MEAINISLPKISFILNLEILSNEMLRASMVQILFS